MVGETVVLGGSIYYLVKEKSVEGWLMVTGMFFVILAGAFQMYIFPSLIQKNDIDAMKVIDYYYVFYAFNIFFSLIFAIGFLMLVMKVVKKKF